MKMKAVCERTGLTERAVRLYIERELVSPKRKEQRGRTYYEFDEDDITMLHTIFVLRGIGFSLEDIHTMICDAGHIAPLYQKLVETTREKAAEYQEIAAKLQAVGQIETCETVQELAERIEQSDVNECIQNSSVKNVVRQNTEEMTYRFGEFDPETEEEKERMYREYLGHYYLRAKRSKRFARLRKVFAPVLDPLGRAMEWFKRKWNYIWKIVLIVILCTSVYLAIPRKVSSCLHWDRQMVENPIVHIMYYDASTNKNEVEFYALGEEEFEGLMEILDQYYYHGYLNALFPLMSIAKTGVFGNMQIWCGIDERISFYTDGSIYINGHPYYLDWISDKNSREMWEEVFEFVREHGEER